MQKIDIPHGTSRLNLILGSDLAKSALATLTDKVSTLLATWDFDLSVEPRTDLGRLLASDIMFPVEVNPTLWEFLQLNLKLTVDSGGEFNPFPGSDLSQPVLQLDPQQSTARKLKDFKFERSTLLMPFKLSKLATFLDKNRINDFCLNYADQYICRGHRRWEVEFSHPLEEEDLELHLQDSTAVLIHQLSNRLHATNEVVENPFADYRGASPLAAVIVEHPDIVTARAVSELALKKYHQFEWTSLARKWNAAITVIANTA